MEPVDFSSGIAVQQPGGDPNGAFTAADSLSRYRSTSSSTSSSAAAAAAAAGYSSLAYNMNLGSGYSGYSAYNQSGYGCLGYPTAATAATGSFSSYGQDALVRLSHSVTFSSVSFTLLFYRVLTV